MNILNHPKKEETPEDQKIFQSPLERIAMQSDSSKGNDCFPEG